MRSSAGRRVKRGKVLSLRMGGGFFLTRGALVIQERAFTSDNEARLRGCMMIRL